MPETQDEKGPARSADLSGTVCPMTFMKAKLLLEQLTEGETVELILEGDEQIRKVPAELKQAGHAIVGVERAEGHYRVLVRRGG